MTGDIFPLQALHRYFHFTLFALTNCFFSLAAGAVVLSHLVVIFYYVHRLCARQ